jgi:hypothetical protein
VAQYGTTEVLDPAGQRFSEPAFINFAFGFEIATKVRAHNLPTFAETIPFTHIQGPTIGVGGRTLLFLKNRDKIERSKRRKSRTICNLALSYRLLLSVFSERFGDKLL